MLTLRFDERVGGTLMTGLRLEASGLPVVATTLADVNRELTVVRSKVRPLDLRVAPAAVRRLLAKPPSMPRRRRR
jgi:hypothetical protein